MIRCPQCNLPLTDDETRNGVCPICAAALAGAAPTPSANPPAHPTLAPTRTPACGWLWQRPSW